MTVIVVLSVQKVEEIVESNAPAPIVNNFGRINLCIAKKSANLLEQG
jgi:hypothetical protein